MNELFRDIRGLPCYLLCCHTPLDHWRRAWFLLLPYAGDWIYREQRRAYNKACHRHESGVA